MSKEKPEQETTPAGPSGSVVASGTDAAPRARPATPYFRRMARKEARVREDQYIALSRLVQILSRRRVIRSGPRLTENTLIRVAIDVLLERADRLSGDTETQLRESVLDKAPASIRWSGPALFDLDAADHADDTVSGG